MRCECGHYEYDVGDLLSYDDGSFVWMCLSDDRYMCVSWRDMPRVPYNEQHVYEFSACVFHLRQFAQLTNNGIKGVDCVC